ncbi:MAG: PhoX family phosphatase [Armatimonadetes bacterium]|nr:PhoX family phosphatase [Armatimonadota bacterium]
MSDFHEEELKHYDPDPVERSKSGFGKLFDEVVASRLTRRDVMKAGAIASIGATALFKATKASAIAEPVADSLGFVPIKPSKLDAVVVPEGFEVQTLIRWGDAMKGGMPSFNMLTQTAEAQEHRFGYNNDFLGYLPLPYGSENSSHGLLVANHEYVNPEMMFPNGNDRATIDAKKVAVMKASMGMGVVEIKQSDNGDWHVIRTSLLNKRYTSDTPFDITGPARGHKLMQTSYDPKGEIAYGTNSNCSAGKTPWGTVLSGEENFQSYFGKAKTARKTASQKQVEAWDRYGIDREETPFRFEDFDKRFDVSVEPNESNHFGWVIEIDPYDPDWTPKKRTALGRFRHEAATTHVTRDGHVVMYSGCDGKFEYIYKFVCRDKFSNDRSKNRELLDSGTLYVAKFNEDGTGIWIPLIHGKNGLTAANGFEDQGEVVIHARLAGDHVGATKMDRPEDMEVNPVNEKLYIACTNNSDRGKEGFPGVDAANPRALNRWGQIVELTENNNDHTSTKFSWELFLVCGDPKDESTHFAGFDKSKVSAIACPDNVTFDGAGNLWIATDGADSVFDHHDGFFVCPVDGPERGYLRQFMSSVKGSEVCGPEFTPDCTTLFLAIQHPGEGSTFENPSTHWPDGYGVPRPSVVAIRAQDGRRIGGPPTDA